MRNPKLSTGKTVKATQGFVVYQGPSMLEPDVEIVCIAVMNSSNVKTGNMIQTYILRTDVPPLDASRSALDIAICGACPHRHSLGGGCYVNIGQSVNAVYKAWLNGNYDTDLTEEDLKALLFGRSLRLGTYGDPAAVPVASWKAIMQHIMKWTGYTHQVNHKNFDDGILDYCMVSADTPKQASKYHEKGYSTFRVKTEGSEALPNEIECKADSHGITCLECGICKGGDTANVYINVHGSRSKRYNDKFANVQLIAVA